MRYFIILLLNITFLATQAQAPGGINYQAAIRNAQGNPLSNQTVSIKFSILTGSANGTVVYAENHNNIQTNQVGIVNLVVGQGTAAQGVFANIDWANGNKFLKVEVDNVLLGTTQLLSVPYALYAEKTNIQAGNGISVNGNVVANTGDNDNNPSNELQTLNISGQVLSLEPNGGVVTLPSNNIAIQPGNGINVSQSGQIFTVTNTGDLSSNNEIQTLGINGNILSLSPNGGEVTLPSSGGGGNPVAPGFTTSQILNMANPAAGMIVLNTDDKALYFYSGMSWYKLNGTLVSQPGSYVLNGPNDCLVAYYTFDDGTATDVVGTNEGNNNGCSFPSEVNSQIGSGKSALFEEGDYISIPNKNPLFGLTQGTICFWIKSTASNCTIVYGANDILNTVFNIQILANQGVNNLYFNTGISFSQNLNANNPPFLPLLSNAWHHVAVVVKPNEHALYIDGTPIDGNNNSSGMTGTNNNTGMLIGKRGGSTNNFFVGHLDNLRIHCKALTAAEIFQIYNAGQ